MKSVTVHCLMSKETEKAFLLALGEDFKIWVPKSQIIEHTFHKENDHREEQITIPAWLAEAKGLLATAQNGMYVYISSADVNY